MIINKTICSAGMNYLHNSVKVYSPEEIANDIKNWSNDYKTAVLIAMLHDKYSTNWNEIREQLKKEFQK